MQKLIILILLSIAIHQAVAIKANKPEDDSLVGVVTV
jgi:hypothetical protein